MKYLATAAFGLFACIALWSTWKGKPVLPPIVLSPFSIDSVEWREYKTKRNRNSLAKRSKVEDEVDGDNQDKQ